MRVFSISPVCVFLQDFTPEKKPVARAPRRMPAAGRKKKVKDPTVCSAAGGKLERILGSALSGGGLGAGRALPWAGCRFSARRDLAGASVARLCPVLLCFEARC